MRFEADTRELYAAARKLDEFPRELTRLNARTLIKAGNRGVATIRRKYRMAGETTATATASRTGALADAYAYEHDAGDGRTQSLTVGVIKPGTDAKVLAYARVHEHRGTTEIRPRRAKFLAIPLDEAKTARGVARGGPRDFVDTFVKRGKSGAPIIYQDRADSIVPLFALVRRVSVKGRPALEPTVGEQIIPEINNGLAANVRAALGSVAS